MPHFGLQLPSFTFRDVPDAELFGRIATIAGAAEDAGFDSFWVMDHYHQIPNIGSPREPMLEAYTVLSGVAARTSRISLGALVTGVTYRNPAYLAKVVTTLDIVSSGRAILGIGAAWNEAESRAYGYDFPSTSERFDRLEDALQICRSMFTHPQSTVRGKVAQVDGAWNVPQPVQPGGPKILIGGGGERKTLRLTASYADMWNGFGDAGMIGHKLEVLREHCDAVGRDPGQIVTTRLGTLIVAETMAEAERRKREWQEQRGIAEESIEARLWWGDPDAIAGQTKAMLDIGLGGLLFNMPSGSTPDDVRLGGEALAMLR